MAAPESAALMAVRASTEQNRTEEPRSSLSGLASHSSGIPSRLHQETISTLAKKRAPGQPAKGAGNLISIPALPEQPSLVPLSTYVVIPTGTTMASRSLHPGAVSPASGQIPVALGPGMTADAAKAAYGAASAALGALGRVSYQRESDGVNKAAAQREVSGEGQSVQAGPERGVGGGEVPSGAVHGGACGGAVQVPGQVEGAGERGTGGGMRAPAVRFDLTDGMRRGPSGGMQNEAGGGYVTYVKLPEPRRFSLSQMR